MYSELCSALGWHQPGRVSSPAVVTGDGLCSPQDPMDRQAVKTGPRRPFLNVGSQHSCSQTSLLRWAREADRP